MQLMTNQKNDQSLNYWTPLLSSLQENIEILQQKIMVSFSHQPQAF